MHVSTSAGVADGATENIWNNIKTGLLKTTEEVCGTTRQHRWRRETWWWNEHVEKAIAAKRKDFKAWKAGNGTRASYDAIIRDGKVPSNWEQSFIVCLYKGKGDALGKGQLPRSRVDRAGYENPGEDCGRPHQTVGVNRRFPVWLRPRQRQSLLSGSCKRSI